MALEAELDVLPEADGSCRFSSKGISVLAAVNGPLEVQRRDELPEEATIDVSVRPSAGLSGVCERFFEGLIHKTLRQIIKAEQFPRTMIQVTLQITASPDTDAMAGRPHQAASLLHLLPPLLNAAMLALLCSSIALSTTMISALVAVGADGNLTATPPVKQLSTAQSVHVFAFDADGELILAESEGSFSIEAWEACLTAGKAQCFGTESDNFNADSTATEAPHTQFKRLIETRIRHNESWRQNLEN